MGRFRLLLNKQPVRTIEDLVNGIDNAIDAVEKFRSGAIAQWLRTKDMPDILQRVEAIDKNATDEVVERALLQSVGHSEEEANSIVLKKRKEAADKKKTSEATVETPTQKGAKERKAKSATPSKRQSAPSKSGATSRKRFSLEAAFALAVENGDIVNLCREQLKGRTIHTRGGKVNWDELASCNGWRLQQNDNLFVRQFVSDHCRILAPDDIRHGYGKRESIEAVFRKYWKEHK